MIADRGTTHARTIRYVAIGLGLVAFQLVKSAPIFNYSVFAIDEQCIVMRALGFLDGDLNPHWFGYHTLPMYLLSAVYYVIYLVYSALGLVASKVEFASLLWSDDAVFYITARVLFSSAHTLGCFVLAVILHRHFRSLLAAVLFFFLVLFISDVVQLTERARVDTFVFLFTTLTVYFGCFAPKGIASFLLAVASCTAAFASKFPAIVLFAPLLVTLVRDVRLGTYPPKYLVYFFALPLGLLFVFMPYAYLDFDTFSPMFERIANRVSRGPHYLPGNVYREGAPEKLSALGRMVTNYTGVLTVLLTGALLIFAALRKRALLLPILFPAAYALSFASSANLEGYWLRPVVYFPLFFSFVFLIEALATPSIGAKVGEFGTWLASRTAGRVSPLHLASVLLAGGFWASVHGGLPDLFELALDKREDNRALASRYIQQNIPEGSTIVLIGFIQHYLPKVFSGNPRTNLTASYYNKRNFVRRNKLLSSGFRHFNEATRNSSRRFKVRLLTSKARRAKIKRGSYIVTSSTVYKRYYRASTMKLFPAESKRVHETYRRIFSQPLVRKFDRSAGRGPTITINRAKGSILYWVAPERKTAGRKKTRKKAGGRGQAR